MLWKIKIACFNDVDRTEWKWMHELDSAIYPDEKQNADDTIIFIRTKYITKDDKSESIRIDEHAGYTN